MKAIIISDIHGKIENFKHVIERHRDVDIVFFAGDIAPYSNIRKAQSLLIEMCDIASDKIILAVPGNMDPPDAYNIPKQNFRSLHGAIYTFNEFVVIGIGGSPPTPFGTIFEIPEDEIRRLLIQAYEQIEKSKPIVVLSHAPPYNTKCDLAMMTRHVGSKALREFIEEHRPRLCICGHIHESRAIDKIDETIIVNPGPLYRGYYAIAEISTDIHVELMKL